MCAEANKKERTQRYIEQEDANILTKACRKFCSSFQMIWQMGYWYRELLVAVNIFVSINNTLIFYNDFNKYEYTRTLTSSYEINSPDTCITKILKTGDLINYIQD